MLVSAQNTEITMTHPARIQRSAILAMAALAGLTQASAQLPAGRVPEVSQTGQADPRTALRRARLAGINDKIRQARLQPAKFRALDIRKLIILSPDIFTDLRPKIDNQLLPVRDQGGTRGTCSVHALAFCQEFITAIKTNQKGLNYSVEYLNWAGNAVAGKPYYDGGFFSDLDKGYQFYGDVSEQACPYQVSFNPNWAPPPTTVSIGKQAPRNTATFIKAWDNSKGASLAQMEEAIAQIKAQRPVAVGVLWPLAFGTQEIDGHDVMKVPARPATFDGHSVVLVGFHRSAKFPGGGYFIFRNSWSKTWGDAGYGYMPFQYVLDLANDLLVYK
jgi:hypothetical protein